MTRNFIFILLFFCICAGSCSQKTKDVLDYVNPMIGTDGIGHTFPGATTPLGMVQLSPSDNTPEWNWCSGYHYSDNTLKGFAHNHFSGTGLAGMGDILLMPTQGEVKVIPGTKNNPDSGYRSRFSHKKEKASPGYYSVFLDDYEINVELTATPRVGIHRYTFQKAGQQNVIFDITHGIAQNILNTSVERLSDSELVGSKYCDDISCGRRKVYFYAKFSKPFKKFGIADSDILVANVNKRVGRNIKAYVQFEGAKNNTVEIAVAISYVDIEGAKANYEAEAKSRSFDEIHKDARELWREKIEKIQVEGTADEKKSIFYTAMYHSFITPNIISDVNGNYMLNGKKHNSPDLVQYSNFSTWDTYRATHPLWSIIDQKNNTNLVKVLTSRFTEAKSGLALWEALGIDNYCMIGYSGIAVMAEAALKHPKGLDKELIFNCIKQTAFRDGGASGNYGSDNGVRYYVNYGFIPGEVGCSVSKTTENNYYDFCISRLAQQLGKTDDYKYFQNRSLGYRNLFNKNTKYLWPRTVAGNWAPMDTTLWNSLKPHYVSGNIWAYSTYTPHDMLGVVKLYGGKENYASWLENMVETPLEMKGEQHVDIAGFIGKYSHGDEPGHQIPYLFNFVGKPWKSQKLVRQVMSEMYSHKPVGFANNEDCGQMSSWYIFSSLGFYPVAPTDLNYYFGSPLHKKAIIKLENGKTFTVVAKNNSTRNKYIQSVTLNGKELNRLYIKHEEIMSGGELVFEMGTTPNKEWANGADALPAYYQEQSNLKTPEMACFAPQFKYNGIVFEDQKQVELTCATENAKIFYTTDGSIPTNKSKLYTGKITLKKPTLIKAIAVKEGIKPSNWVSHMFWRTLKKDLSNWKPSKQKALDKYGNVVQALVVDPFRADNISIAEMSKIDFLNGENSIQPKIGWLTGDKLWRVTKANNSNVFDLCRMKLNGPTENACSYLSFWVYSPSDLEAGKSGLDFLWGCDDGTNIFINGKSQREITEPQGLVRDRYKLNSIGLNKGWNHFLIKVMQGGGDWHFAGRFSSSNSELLKNLKSLVEKK